MKSLSAILGEEGLGPVATYEVYAWGRFNLLTGAYGPDLWADPFEGYIGKRIERLLLRNEKGTYALLFKDPKFAGDQNEGDTVRLVSRGGKRLFSVEKVLRATEMSRDQLVADARTLGGKSFFTYNVNKHTP